MMWYTHAAIGASATWSLLPFVPLEASTNITVLMGFCVVGALMPDLDAVESKIKHIKVMKIKPFVPISRAINRDFGHRHLLHSLPGWVIWTFLILPLGVTIGWLAIAALSLGYTSHLAGDACTRTGIPLLYPKRIHYHLLPCKMRVVTGSDYEEIFFTACALSAVALLVEHL